MKQDISEVTRWALMTAREDSTARVDAAIRDRIAGMTWQQVADRHGYKTAASARNVCWKSATRRGMNATRLAVRYRQTSTRPREALAARLAGASWQEIATRFGYKSPASASATVLSICATREERERARDAYTRPPLPPRRVRAGYGYWSIAGLDGHPLADGRGRVAEHRFVVFSQFGFGPVACFDCGLPIAWADVEVHHLDHDRGNNAPENLVAACGDCHFAETMAFTQARRAAMPF